MNEIKLHSCHFCSKPKQAVAYILEAERASICNECVGICVKALAEQMAKDEKGRTGATESNLSIGRDMAANQGEEK